MSCTWCKKLCQNKVRCICGTLYCSIKCKADDQTIHHKYCRLKPLIDAEALDKWVDANLYGLQGYFREKRFEGTRAFILLCDSQNNKSKNSTPIVYEQKPSADDVIIPVLEGENIAVLCNALKRPDLYVKHISDFRHVIVYVFDYKTKAKQLLDITLE